jgi:hypothetical protein
VEDADQNHDALLVEESGSQAAGTAA